MKVGGGLWPPADETIVERLGRLGTPARLPDLLSGVYFGTLCAGSAHGLTAYYVAFIVPSSTARLLPAHQDASIPRSHGLVLQRLDRISRMTQIGSVETLGGGRADGLQELGRLSRTSSSRYQACLAGVCIQQ